MLFLNKKIQNGAKPYLLLGLISSVFLQSLLLFASPKVVEQSQKPSLVKHSLPSKDEVTQYFDKVIVDIDATLFAQQDTLKKADQSLIQFVDSSILPYWDVELTLRQLMGSQYWKKLTEKEILSLKGAFSRTLHRYVKEGMGHYDGQRIKFVSVKLNSKNTKGLLTVQLEPIYLPTFNINFKIARSDDNWLLYDVLVEGISYVRMKKSEYRQIIREKGFDGLLAHLDKKNNHKES